MFPKLTQFSVALAMCISGVYASSKPQGEGFFSKAGRALNPVRGHSKVNGGWATVIYGVKMIFMSVTVMTLFAAIFHGSGLGGAKLALLGTGIGFGLATLAIHNLPWITKYNTFYYADSEASTKSHRTYGFELALDLCLLLTLILCAGFGSGFGAVMFGCLFTTLLVVKTMKCAIDDKIISTPRVKMWFQEIFKKSLLDKIKYGVGALAFVFLLISGFIPGAGLVSEISSPKMVLFILGASFAVISIFTNMMQNGMNKTETGGRKCLKPVGITVLDWMMVILGITFALIGSHWDVKLPLMFGALIMVGLRVFHLGIAADMKNAKQNASKMSSSETMEILKHNAKTIFEDFLVDETDKSEMIDILLEKGLSQDEWLTQQLKGFRDFDQDNTSVTPLRKLMKEIAPPSTDSSSEWSYDTVSSSSSSPDNQYSLPPVPIYVPSLDLESFSCENDNRPEPQPIKQQTMSLLAQDKHSSRRQVPNKPKRRSRVSSESNDNGWETYDVKKHQYVNDW